MNYYFFLDVGEFLNKKPSDIRSVVVGQAAFIKCPQHTSGNNFIYKWGKTSGGSGTRFITAGSNYIVLENGSLFFSHLKERDVGYINDFHATCGMEANVGKDNRFTWSHVVTLKNVSRKYPKLKLFIELGMSSLYPRLVGQLVIGSEYFFYISAKYRIGNI